MSNEFASGMEEFLDSMAPIMVTQSFSSLLGLAAYILSSLALYSFAKRRGIHHAWLAWIPVGSLWILGSLSDQYQYVAKGAVKNKRKVLLTLSLIEAGIIILMSGVMVSGIVMGIASHSEEELFEALFGPLMGAALLVLPVAGLAIAMLVIRYMALYDLYRSACPENAVMFLVLGIFFKITEPFFLFFNRTKDAGMVREQPQYAAAYQAPSYVNQDQSQPRQPDPVYEAPRESQQNPAGMAEPWTQKPENQDPWNQGPEQL